MKKSNVLLGFSALCLITLTAVSCGKKQNGGGGGSTPDVPSNTVNVLSYELKSNSIDGKFRVGETGVIVPMNVLPTNATKEFTFTTQDTNVITLREINGSFECIGEGKATINCISDFGEVEQTITIEVSGQNTKAVGGYNYQASTPEQKAEIIGKLEGWAMDNHLTGITLFQNGGYVLYNPRLTLGSDKYIPGYGFGNLSDGIITESKPLVNNDSEEKYGEYYHTILTSAPGNINYLNSQGEVVGNLYGYVSAGLWQTRMNETKDGYVWYNNLAKSDIKPLDTNKDTGLATKFEVQVKTKKDGLVYSTMSAKRKEKFDGLGVEVEDYRNAYKQLLTQANGLSRGAEITSLAQEGTLAGASAYYNASNSGVNDALFDKYVGIKVKEGTDDTLIFTLAKPTTPFLAKYSLASNLTMPIPESFVEEIGGMSHYGSNFTDKKDPSKSSKVIDNILCLGPYVIEEFNKDENKIIFKLNEKNIDKVYVETLKKNGGSAEEIKEAEAIAKRYQIKGIHNYIVPSASEEQMLEYFNKGVIDACGVPQNQITEYAGDPRVRKSIGDSTFKLNVNSSTKEEWDLHYEEVFKKKGAGKYEDLKPIMSNDNFLMGLNESIDRIAFAEAVGASPSQNYFGDGYLYDPENGKSYNSTVYHQANLATRFPETYGFNFDAAVDHFALAVQELIDSGEYMEKLSNPNGYTEKIVINWMGPEDEKLYGKKVKDNIERAFNSEPVLEVSGGKFKLEVVNENGTQNYEDVYNKHLQVGKFDLGFGSISGNALNPLNFMEVLKSDNSSGFTLNWGRPTNIVDEKLTYDGKAWSFDSLWTAANSGAVITETPDEKGRKYQLVKDPIELNVTSTDIVYDENTKAYNVVIKWNVANVLAGSKDIKIGLSKDGVLVFAKYNKEGGKTDFIIRMVEDVDYSKDGQISFAIKYDDLDTKSSDLFIKSRKLTFQINYEIEINGIKTSGFVSKDSVKTDNSK